MTDLPHPHPPFALGSQSLGALPIVQAFLGRAGVQRVWAATCRPATPA